MSTPRVHYTRRPDATPESEAAVLASVYRFILDCHAKKNAAGCEQHHDGEDGTEIKGDSAYGRSIHERTEIQ